MACRRRTSETLAVGGQETSETLAAGGQQTSATLAVGEQKTSATLAVGGPETSATLAVGGQETSETLAVGGQETSETLAVGGQETSETLAVGGQETSETFAVGAQKTSKTPAIGERETLKPRGQKIGQKKYAQIYAFSRDVYNFIWTKHQFRFENLYFKFCENENYRFWNREHANMSPFTEDIGTAVLCSQFLLRELCMDFFRHFQKLILHSRESFVYYVNIIQLILSEYRTDVFLRLIDTSAVIAEALLFWDSQQKPLIELDDTKDILVDFFETYLSSTFFKKGGWKKLQNLARLYNPIYTFLTPYISIFRVSYVIIFYDCRLINYLRECPVSFPVQEFWFCHKCRIDTDEPFQILNPESTIEGLISKHFFQQPPWDHEVSIDIPIIDLQTGTSQYSSSVLKDEFYISLGGGVESASESDLKTLIENLPIVKPQTMKAFEKELTRFFEEEEAATRREVRTIMRGTFKKNKNRTLEFRK